MSNVSPMKRPTGPWAEPRLVTSREHCFFYHTSDLADGEVAIGHWDLRGRFSDYVAHVPMAGARVLDVGTASGFLTFEAEAAGAASVVSFDLDTAARQHLLPFHDSLYVRDHAAWVERQTAAFDGWKNAYWFLHRQRASTARVVYGDVYDLPAGIGRFDVVILGSILEHLGDPIRAVASIARVTEDTIVVNTDTIDDAGPMARFNGRPDHPDRDYIFWTYSIETYRLIFEICGFKLERVREDAYRTASPHASADGWQKVARTTLVARRRASARR